MLALRRAHHPIDEHVGVAGDDPAPGAVANRPRRVDLRDDRRQSLRSPVKYRQMRRRLAVRPLSAFQPLKQPCALRSKPPPQCLAGEFADLELDGATLARGLGEGQALVGVEPKVGEQPVEPNQGQAPAVLLPPRRRRGLAGGP